MLDRSSLDVKSAAGPEVGSPAALAFGSRLADAHVEHAAPGIGRNRRLVHGLQVDDRRGEVALAVHVGPDDRPEDLSDRRVRAVTNAAPGRALEVDRGEVVHAVDAQGLVALASRGRIPPRNVRDAG